ncbi:MAG: hypothetical protein B6D68_00615 [spirochete symbiont of Stewartia floridana]|nr:MAG: hypothetical protein B6D68_00615 [spirochete symbiont of Stewartia floridana]
MLLLQEHTDKLSIMKRQRMRITLTFILVFLVVTGLFAEEAWKENADRANSYFWKHDYNAAWLFYERTLAQGCADGVILFRAAKSFQNQELAEDSKLLASLYTAAHYFLLEQYPDDTGIEISRRYFDTETRVDQKFIRKLYKQFGGKPPRIKSKPVRVEDAKTFITQSIDDTAQFIATTRAEGIKAGLLWARERTWHSLAVLFMVILITGIILPLTMAVAVSKEGRKSYVTAYAFLFYWGFLGIHRFYLNRWKSGLIWLFTAGLFGLGIFFDIFLTGAYVRFWNEDNRGNRPQGVIGRQRNRPRRPRPTRVKPATKNKPSQSYDFSLEDREFDSAPTQSGSNAAGGIDDFDLDDSADFKIPNSD